MIKSQKPGTIAENKRFKITKKKFRCFFFFYMTKIIRFIVSKNACEIMNVINPFVYNVS